jgi:hypothetical protein
VYDFSSVINSFLFALDKSGLLVYNRGKVEDKSTNDKHYYTIDCPKCQGFEKESTVSKKDYKKFAELIKNRLDITLYPTNDLHTVLGIAYDMTEIFQRDNTGFDKQRFLLACGILDGSK